MDAAAVARLGGIILYRAIADRWAAFEVTHDTTAIEFNCIPCENTVPDRRTAFSAKDSTPHVVITIHNCETIQYRVFSFAGMKVKTAVRLGRSAVAVYDAISRAVFAGDSDFFAQKINIPIAIPRVGSISHKNCVPIVSVNNCRLDIIEIRETIVINGNYSRLTGKNRQEQTDTKQGRYTRSHSTHSFLITGIPHQTS
jgi:hypothetical protein